MIEIPKVLVVDDDEALVFLVGKLLRRKFKQRIAVTMKSDSVTAMGWIEEVQPEVIITDLDMPNVDGFVLSREAKKLNPDVQIIVFSGHMDECVERFAKRFGATECVAKNGEFAELLSAVERVLGSLPIDQSTARQTGAVSDRVQTWSENQASAE